MVTQATHLAARTSTMASQHVTFAINPTAMATRTVRMIAAVIAICAYQAVDAPVSAIITIIMRGVAEAAEMMALI